MIQRPEEILGTLAGEGMTVLEAGPGMGFFTLEMARRVGPAGRVVAVDIEPRMLEGLKRRAEKAGLLERIDLRLAGADSMGIEDLAGRVDFVLAFAVVHEMPSVEGFFRQAARALKAGGNVLFAEPAGHVKPEAFEAELESAARAGLRTALRPAVRRSRAAVLIKGSPDATTPVAP
jgi:ubiquinone/menaquinone biosynthesis C-methylase UbiE